jgi:hypothetical protein
MWTSTASEDLQRTLQGTHGELTHGRVLHRALWRPLALPSITSISNRRIAMKRSGNPTSPLPALVYSFVWLTICTWACRSACADKVGSTGPCNKFCYSKCFLESRQHLLRRAMAKCLERKTSVRSNGSLTDLSPNLEAQRAWQQISLAQHFLADAMPSMHVWQCMQTSHWPPYSF